MGKKERNVGRKEVECGRGWGRRKEKEKGLASGKK